MMSRTRLRLGPGLLALIAGALTPGLVTAQSVIATASSSPWQIAFTPYAWATKIEGTQVLPIRGTTTTFGMDADDVLNHLNLAWMSSFDVHYRRFGFFNDTVFANLGASKYGFHAFTIPGADIPVTTSAYVNFSIKTWVVTSALEYRVAEGPEITMDLLAGARYASMKPQLNYALTGSIGDLPPATRSGSLSAKADTTAAIVGFKGQIKLGDSGWYLPLYADAGGYFTWQAAGGFAYKLSYGEVVAMYRYLSYSFGDTGLKNLILSGPMLGATLRW